MGTGGRERRDREGIGGRMGTWGGIGDRGRDGDRGRIGEERWARDGEGGGGGEKWCISSYQV